MTVLTVRDSTVAPVRVRQSPIVLVAHGSRDPRSARTMRDLATAVDRRWAGGARVAFLDFNPPSVPLALRESFVGVPSIVVPALLTRAYHGRVDVPEVVSASVVPSVITPVLGPAGPSDAPDPLLVAALGRRLSELDTGYDGLVLAAAGTSYQAARSTVESVAAALESTVDVACTVGYATTSAPTIGDAVRAMRARGAVRVAVASYFLAAGTLHDLAVESAVDAGAVGVTAPLGVADELLELVISRAKSVA
jgi:sirohydrochlorin ferrochelatase